MTHIISLNRCHHHHHHHLKTSGDGEIERQEQGSGVGSPQLSHHAALIAPFVILTQDITITIAAKCPINHNKYGRSGNILYLVPIG